MGLINGVCPQADVGIKPSRPVNVNFRKGPMSLYFGMLDELKQIGQFFGPVC